MDAEDIFRKLTSGAIPRFLKLPSNEKVSVNEIIYRLLLLQY